MAKNFKAYEAAKIICEGMNKDNFEDYSDILRRFPAFAMVCVGLNEAGLMIIQSLPEYYTARKINKALKVILGVEESDDLEENVETPADIEEEEKVEKPKKAKKVKKVVEEEDEEEVPFDEEPNDSKEEDDDDDFDFD